MKPTLKEIKKYVKQIDEGTETYTSLGKKYGVSDNGFRKWVIKSGVKMPVKNVKGLFDYTCGNCGNIFQGRSCREKNRGKDGLLFCCRKCRGNWIKSKKK